MLQFLNKSKTLRIFLTIGFFALVVGISSLILPKYFSLLWETNQGGFEKVNTLEGLRKKLEEEKQETCLEMMNNLENEGNCKKFRKSSNQDACYFCFAITNNDESLCSKISKGTSLRKNCEEEFLVLEEMDWKIHDGDGYSIKYPPYLEVISDPLASSPTFSLKNANLAEKAGFKFGKENIFVTIDTTDLTRDSFAAKQMHDFFKHKEDKDTVEINGRVFYKEEDWGLYSSVGEVAFEYVTKSDDKTEAIRIRFELDGVSKEDVASRLGFKEEMLSSLEF